MITNSARVGFYLANRQIRRSSWWTTTLIIFIMTLTFLNMVVVSGILVGLVEGARRANREYYYGDAIVSTLDRKAYIERSSEILRVLQTLPQVTAVSARYSEAAVIEAGYKTRTRADESLDSVQAVVMGIDPIAEDRVTGMSRLVIEGRFLTPEDHDKIVIGANLLFSYAPVDSPGQRTLKTVGVGDTVRLRINGTVREVEIIGVTKSKTEEIDRRIIMLDDDLRKLIERTDYNVAEIVMRVAPTSNPTSVTTALKASGFSDVAKIQTYEEAEPKFVEDIAATFGILGTIIGGIGLAVASITIFIVIFINAITRKKYIGILKGIGITGAAIEYSYVFQSIFYAIIGSAVGFALLYGLLVPYFDQNPINFPFSDGVLVAPFSSAWFRFLVLLATTIIAGYVPAKMVIRANTLDAILGR